MTPHEAKKAVESVFPFNGYIERAVNSYSLLAETIMRHVKPGGKILDFGSGPCDKTAVLQKLGYECYAYDDLQDEWHGIGNNREKIRRFAEEMGIKLFVTNDRKLPFEENFFDMIMANDVIEHLHDSPRDLLNQLITHIKPGGFLFLTVPNAAKILNRLYLLTGKSIYPSFNVYYFYPECWRGHIREYTLDDLDKLATYLDLQLIELSSHNCNLNKLPAVIRYSITASCRVIKGGGDTLLFLAKKKPNWHIKIFSPVQLRELYGRRLPYFG